MKVFVDHVFSIKIEISLDDQVPDLACDTHSKDRYYQPLEASMTVYEDTEGTWHSANGLWIRGPQRKRNNQLGKYWLTCTYGSLANPIPMEIFDLLMAHGEVPDEVKHILVTTMAHKATPTRPHRP